MRLTSLTSFDVHFNYFKSDAFVKALILLADNIGTICSVMRCVSDAHTKDKLYLFDRFSK